jgi:hypothetical protein
MSKILDRLTAFLCSSTNGYIFRLGMKIHWWRLRKNNKK